ncbi:MAG: aldo/keto reductase, partial [Phycisphaeraceae bacterium]
MQYRRFGRTELRMPVISTGGMRYQDGWTDKPMSEVDPKVHKNLIATIDHSIQVGINHIETARGYGVSERQLGTVLPNYPREELIVQTKIGPEDDPEKFTANFMESLDRLNLDHVDLLAIHGINNDETLKQSIREGGCLDAARALQSKGLCKHVGFSTHGPLRIILEAINADPRDAAS